MKSLWIVAAAGLTTLAACSEMSGPSGVRVDCGAIDVVMDTDTAAAIRANQADGNFAANICGNLQRVDTSKITGPVNAKIATAAGNEYDVRFEPSEG